MTNKSVTQEVVPYKNYEIKARCDGKYDFVSTHYFTPGTPSYDVSMTDYDGFNYVYNQFNDSILDLSNTILPWKWDYSTALSSTSFSLFNTDKFKVVPNYLYGLNDISYRGYPTVSSDYILTDTSTSAYLRTKNTFEFTNPFTLSFHYKNDYVSSTNGYFLRGSSSASYLSFRLYNNYLRVYILGTMLNLGTITTGKLDGICKVTWDGETYTASYIGNDGVSLSNTLSSTNSISNMGFYIGYCYNSEMDLKQFTFTNSYTTYKVVDYYQSGYKKAQGCLYNYTDDGSAVTLNCFTSDKDKGIVLTPDSTYNDERLLGTVDIPAHSVEEYVTTTFDITPSDAEYSISTPLDAYTSEGKSITTCKNTTCITCAASKEGYDMQTIYITPTATSTYTISLEAASTWLDVTDYSYNRDENDLVTLWYQGDDEDVTIPEIQGRSE